jgi:hypothetical protein
MFYQLHFQVMAKSLRLPVKINIAKYGIFKLEKFCLI